MNYIETDKVGTTRYFYDKEMKILHREDGPAIECSRGGGYKEWYLNGELHREDGPAIEWATGDKEWYKNDKLHREDGPAIEMRDGEKEWWINGIEYTEEEFDEKINPTKVNINGSEFTIADLNSFIADARKKKKSP